MRGTARGTETMRNKMALVPLLLAGLGAPQGKKFTLDDLKAVPALFGRPKQ